VGAPTVRAHGTYEQRVQHVLLSLLVSLCPGVSNLDGRVGTACTARIYPQVLLACALAKTDELGYFPAGDIRIPLKEITGKRYEIPSFSRHLNDFCESGRGPVLQKTGAAYRNKFRFINPLVQPYTIMQGRANQLIDKEKLAAIKQMQG